MERLGQNGALTLGWPIDLDLVFFLIGAGAKLGYGRPRLSARLP